MSKERIAVFPGTFDPPTLGHQSLIERSSKLFDQLIIALSVNTEKHPLFTVEERLDMLRLLCEPYDNVKIEISDGLTAEFAKNHGVKYLLRGLRAMNDFESERMMAQANKHLVPDLETIFLPTDPEHAFVSSSLVRDVLKHTGSIESLVPPTVWNYIKQLKKDS